MRTPRATVVLGEAAADMWAGNVPLDSPTALRRATDPGPVTATAASLARWPSTSDAKSLAAL